MKLSQRWFAFYFRVRLRWLRRQANKLERKLVSPGLKAQERRIVE